MRLHDPLGVHPNLPGRQVLNPSCLLGTGAALGLGGASSSASRENYDVESGGIRSEFKRGGLPRAAGSSVATHCKPSKVTRKSPVLLCNALGSWISLVNLKRGISLVFFGVCSVFSKGFVGSAGKENPW